MPLEKEDLKKTVNLPKTDFGMKANLSELEPRLLERWEKDDLYGKIRRAREGAEKYILHDGPPYASGELHIGTGMNKILKDIVVKWRTMLGFDAPYIPGWDCHGLPIEQKVQTEMQKQKASWDKPEIRRRSEEFARKHIEGHRRQFKALGILGRWERPYLTLDPRYEAGVIDVFGRLVEKGYVYRRRRPIHWCPADQTALAEAELEYEEREDPSVYLRFRLYDDGLACANEEVLGEGSRIARVPSGLLVWTTTPWTLFGNVAVAVHPDEEYDLVDYIRKGKREASWVARPLRERVLAKIGGTEPMIMGTLKGSRLEGLKYERPFLKPAIERPASIVCAPYVSMTDGTGLVHTAPGHGREDYETALRVGLPVVSPVDVGGKLTDEVPFEFRGEFVLKANQAIVEHLRDVGILVHAETVKHSYPHCWRCHGPLIFRATAQWFVGVDHREKEGAPTLRERALECVRSEVEWTPEYGLSRIAGMLEERPDWCISRQRAWGIPIPAFYCAGCGEPLLNKASCDRIRDLFREHGANAWFTRTAKELFGDGGFACAKCGKTELVKEDDIFDVWFESGSSWHSVVEEEPELRYPSDLYLEGSDQHRGWFQLSLIPALAATGTAPFRAVDTRGFVVDERGEKMSKSIGNYISLADGLKRFSGDILRLWFSSIDTSEDIKVSVALLEKMREGYRRIRNTFKYLLGNLHDWPAETPSAEPDALDRWILAALERVRKEVETAYGELRFHRVYRAIHDFCAVELSTVYFEAVRDRLYCERPDDPRRRATQNALGTILSVLVRLLAPILVYTCEEVWDHMRAQPWGRGWLTESVHLAPWPRADADVEEADLALGEKLLLVREQVYKALEPLRRDKVIGEPTDAVVDVATNDPEVLRALEAIGAEKLAELLVVAGASVGREGSGLFPGVAPLTGEAPAALAIHVTARRSPHPKCERCWVLRPTVEARPSCGGASLCARCAGVIGAV